MEPARPHLSRRCCLVVLLSGAAGLLTPRRPASAAGWPDERSAGPFICHADFALDRFGPLLNELEILQRDLVRILGVQAARETVHLFLFQHKSAYQDYVGYYFPNVPYRRALFIKQRGPGMVFAYRSHELAVDVRHESTHALLHAAMPMVPLWLDEGLAEYFEVAADQRADHNPHLTAVRWSTRLGQMATIESLEQVSELSKMGRAEYRNAWAWVHFMLHGSPEAYAELVRFLGDIQAHTPPGRLSERLRRRIGDLDRRFAAHFRNWPNR